MQLFNCPILGARPRSEFTCAGGAINLLNKTDGASARTAIYFGDATARIKEEWWYHRPSHWWFVITRDTANDDVIAIGLADATLAASAADEMPK